MTQEQQSDYTDRNVAEMLGLYKEGWYLLLESCKCSPPVFGLSTPPGPEADANAARYVLQWLKANGYDLWIEIINGDICRVTVALLYHGSWRAEGEHFGPTLCRACLDAVRATSSA